MKVNKIILIERLNERNQLVTVKYVTSVTQLYKFLEGKMKQRRKEMPYTPRNLRNRIQQMSYNVPNWPIEDLNYRVTKVGEYRKAS